ncbi:MAG: glycoside hydrolase family 32 protein [Phototrophicaceae bacterium]
MIDTTTLDIRKTFSSDPSRPSYHYQPPSNWMNDPNGVIQWQGQYHLFYQYNPYGANHANMHWGHAVSDDLLHWQDLPIALSPTPNAVDRGGIFSGSAVNHEGVPTIFYTGVTPDYEVQVQCMATSNDGLLTWQKHPQNPVIATVPAEAKQTSEFRDPFVWHQDNMWHMLLGSNIRDVGGTVFLYQSSDLINWDYKNPILIGSDGILDAVWECPNLFKLGDKWVLIVSRNYEDITGDVIYFVGDYANGIFTPDFEGILDHAYLYAPLTLEDDTGRRILWGWVREGRSQDAFVDAGWSGMQSFPRELGLDSENRLITKPVDEIEALRAKCHSYENIALSGNVDIDVRSLALDIVGQFQITPQSDFTLSLACSEDAQVCTEVSYSATTGQLSVNRDKSSKNSDEEHHVHSVHHPLGADEILELRILLDGSVIEIIANERTSITTRIYPENFDNNYLQLKGNDTRLIKLDIYEMSSIWSI